MIDFVLSVIRGRQEGREFYVTRCQVGTILKVFVFDDEFISPEMKQQCAPSKRDWSGEALYNMGTPRYSALAAIVAFVDGDLSYQQLNQTNKNSDIGQIKVSVDVPIVVVEGKKRRLAIEDLLQSQPELRDSYVPVILYQTQGDPYWLQRHYSVQSVPCEVSERDRPTVVAKAVVGNVPVFRELTDLERSSLPTRSQKLFTLSAIEKATQALLEEYEDEEVPAQINLAVRYWSAVCDNMPDWNRVLQGEMSSGKIRQDYIHGHAVTLTALGHLGKSLITTYPKDWERHLEKLQDIDWSRSNPEWQKRIIVKGRVSKSRKSVNAIIAYLKQVFGLPLIPEDKES